MAKIKVKQIEKSNWEEIKQRKILISLGLNKINREKVFNENPAITGMIDKVKHLVKFEKV